MMQYIIKLLLKTQIQHTKDKSKYFRQKVPKATTLIHVNQCNTDKQNLDKKIRNADKGCTSSCSHLKLKNKIPNTSSLVTTTVLNAEIGEVENKFPDHAKCITTHKVNN